MNRPSELRLPPHAYQHDGERRANPLVGGSLRIMRRAHARVHAALKRGTPIPTPYGTVIGRPEDCQACGDVPKHAGGPLKQSGIEAHHYDGYGTPEKDLRVIFLCRSCHRGQHA